MPQQSLTIRLQARDIKGAVRLQNACGCTTPGDALHAALDLFALMPEELIEQVQASAQRNARSLNQQFVVLLQEAIQLRESHQEWKDYAKEVQQPQ